MYASRWGEGSSSYTSTELMMARIRVSGGSQIWVAIAAVFQQGRGSRPFNMVVAGEAVSVNWADISSKLPRQRRTKFAFQLLIYRGRSQCSGP